MEEQKTLKRDLVKQHYAESNSYSQTARHFGISQQAVYNYCHWEPKEKMYDKITKMAIDGYNPDEVAVRLGTTLEKMRAMARYAGYMIKDNRFIKNEKTTSSIPKKSR
jgi:DNA-binding CsgD family transcriptional regulator